MADTKISALAAASAVVAANELAINEAGTSKKVTAQQVMDYVAGTGWVTVTDTWAYSAYVAANRTGIITVPTDATDKYSVGMRIKITQATDGVKYGIITVVIATALTVFFENDSDLDDEDISLPHYSSDKAPFGFPMSVESWQITVLNETVLSQADPTAATWYNLGSLSIVIPIGVWELYYTVHLVALRGSAGVCDPYVTLSTANDTESSKYSTSSAYISSDTNFQISVSKRFWHILTTAATYYLNAKFETAGGSSLRFGGTQAGTLIRAVCSYL